MIFKPLSYEEFEKRTLESDSSVNDIFLHCCVKQYNSLARYLFKSRKEITKHTMERALLMVLRDDNKELLDFFIDDFSFIIPKIRLPFRFISNVDPEILVYFHKRTNYPFDNSMKRELFKRCFIRKEYENAKYFLDLGFFALDGNEDWDDVTWEHAIKTIKEYNETLKIKK